MKEMKKLKVNAKNIKKSVHNAQKENEEISQDVLSLISVYLFICINIFICTCARAITYKYMRYSYACVCAC